MVKAPRVQAAKIAQSSDRDMADGFIEPNFRTGQQECPNHASYRSRKLA
jgi:hypothetical protein